MSQIQSTVRTPLTAIRADFVLAYVDFSNEASEERELSPSPLPSPSSSPPSGSPVLTLQRLTLAAVRAWEARDAEAVADQWPLEVTWPISADDVDDDGYLHVRERVFSEDMDTRNRLEPEEMIHVYEE